MAKNLGRQIDWLNEWYFNKNYHNQDFKFNVLLEPLFLLREYQLKPGVKNELERFNQNKLVGNS